MKTVLIVDDEPNVQNVLKRICSLLGYAPVIADSSENALKKFSMGSFDLVILDIVMPEMGGFEVAREMKRIRPDQIIVMVSGLGREEALNRSYIENVYVEDFLSKPFSYENIKSVLTNVLNNDKKFALRGG